MGSINNSNETSNGSLDLGEFDYPPLEMVQSVEVRSFFVTLYTATAVLSMLSNLTVIYVLSRGQRWGVNVYTTDLITSS
jgi:hypothetical protein